MEYKKLFITFLAAAALIVGCKEEEDTRLPVLNVAQTELAFEKGGGTATIAVTSNRAWTISTDEDWLAFNPSSGVASDNAVSVTVTALANPSSDRTGSFKVKTDFDYRTISVTQPGEKGEDTTNKPSGNGTLEDPYNAAGVVAYIKTLPNDTESPSAVYVKGIISRVATTFEASGSYGNATFYISGDGTTSSTQFYCYQTYYLGNKKWTSGNTDVKVGDEVVICGKVINYKGDTPETVGKGGSYVYSLNGVVQEVDPGWSDLPNATGEGTEASPYNVAKVLNVMHGASYPSETVYVSGTVSRIDSVSTKYKSIYYYLSDDGTPSNEFYVFSGKGLGGEDVTKADYLKVGDKVTAAGTLTIYNKVCEFKNGSKIVSLNGSGPSEATKMTVAEAIAAGSGANVIVEDVLVYAKYARGVMIGDGTNFMVVYSTNGVNAQIGDKITVTGTTSVYSELVQLAPDKVEVTSTGNTVTYPAVVDIESQFDTYTATIPTYITYTGTVSKSGNYYNVAVAGASTMTGSIQYPLDGAIPDNLVGIPVRVTGFFTGISSSKYSNIMMTAIEASSTPYLSVSPTEKEVDAATTSVALTISSNVEWTVSSTDGNVTFDNAAGNGDATVTVSFPANTSSEATVTIPVTVKGTGVSDVAVTITQRKAITGTVSRADFETFNDGEPKLSYGSYSTTTGWKAENCCILKGGESDANPIYQFLGYMTGSASEYAMAACMNGKTSAVGTITSPTLTGGCGTLSFNYGCPYSETKDVSFRVDVKQGGNVVKTFTVTQTYKKVTAFSFSEEVNVEGEFTIVFTNLSPSEADSNKDRYAVWNVMWTGVE